LPDREGLRGAGWLKKATDAAKLKPEDAALVKAFGDAVDASGVKVQISGRL
jgi:hypothetical protein